MKRSIFSVVLAVAMAAAASLAQSAIIPLHVNLSGANEVPPNASQGTGVAYFQLDTITNELTGHIEFSGLTGTTTAAHIHCCLATPFLTGMNVGVATLTPAFPGFPIGVTSGVDDFILDLDLASSYRAGFITDQGGLANAEANFINGLLTGRTYLNIHTTAFGGGEIRGFVIPEPMTVGLIAMGLAAAAFGSRRRKRT